MNLNSIYIFVFLFTVNVISFAQEKSKHIEKINGKEYYVHQIKKRESLYGISKLYGIEIDDILNENPIVKEQGLKAGYNLLIPLKIEKGLSSLSIDTIHYKYHKVMKGETVYSICKQNNITQEQFYEWNPDKKVGIKENDRVIVGKKSYSSEPLVNNNNQLIKKRIDSLIKKNTLDFGKLEKKRKYNIVLLLPFNANKAGGEIIIEDMIKTKQEFPPLSSMMIDFFTGFQYAVDSLKSDSFNVKLVPIDINENDTLKLQDIISSNEYKNADIIIGPVFSSLIKTEQKINPKRKFHIIPFIGQNKFLFNRPEYSKTTPSLYVDIKSLAYYVFDSLRKNSKIVLIYSNIDNEKEYSKEFKKYYNELIYQNKLKDTIHTFRNINDFKKIVKDKENYTVILLTNNQIVATDYITQLSIINKNSPITLCGFYKAITFDNLDLEYLSQMRYIFAYYQNLNYRHMFSSAVKKYKEQFYTDPSVMFYEGFQIGLYYMDILKRQGLSGLLQLDIFSFTNKDNFMRFTYYHPDTDTGFQNHGEFIFQILERKVVLKR